ncbi:MAG: hypothetical protein J5I90_03030 [Caldilineales bacterium]|nr:hypothetical protein [Caldilineales bacterium]
MTDQPIRTNLPSDSNSFQLQFLTLQQVRQVDLALGKVGSFGEVRLIVSKGRLRFIQITHSESVQGTSHQYEEAHQ